MAGAGEGPKRAGRPLLPPGRGPPPPPRPRFEPVDREKVKFWNLESSLSLLVFNSTPLSILGF